MQFSYDLMFIMLYWNVNSGFIWIIMKRTILFIKKIRQASRMIFRSVPNSLSYSILWLTPNVNYIILRVVISLMWKTVPIWVNFLLGYNYCLSNTIHIVVAADKNCCIFSVFSLFLCKFHLRSRSVAWKVSANIKLFLDVLSCFVKIDPTAFIQPHTKSIMMIS